MLPRVYFARMCGRQRFINLEGMCGATWELPVQQRDEIATPGRWLQDGVLPAPGMSAEGSNGLMQTLCGCEELAKLFAHLEKRA
tara:strand:+ start:753 stop:1004 length:252 start_codon:yes stop_codon:yes gene_type:complete